jgi:DNA-binding NarL/FixJ family response regulator
MNHRETIALLLIEDSPLDVFLFRQALLKVKDPCFQLLHAERLADAMLLLRDHQIDLICTDLNLPDTTGTEAVQKLVRANSEAPVIALTGYQDPDLETRLLEEGACAVLLKDQLTATALSEAIDHVMRRKGAD